MIRSCRQPFRETEQGSQDDDGIEGAKPAFEQRDLRLGCGFHRFGRCGIAVRQTSSHNASDGMMRVPAEFKSSVELAGLNSVSMCCTACCDLIRAQKIRRSIVSAREMSEQASKGIITMPPFTIMSMA